MTVNAPTYDFAQTRKRWDQFIRRRGRLACLRRIGLEDRQVYVFEAEFTPQERVGKMLNPVDRKMVVSALASDGTPLDPPPHKDKDQLVTYVIGTFRDDEALKIFEPPTLIRPGGVVLMYHLRVRA